MGRRAKVTNALSPEYITPEKLELASRIMAAAGVGIIALGIAEAVTCGVDTKPPIDNKGNPKREKLTKSIQRIEYKIAELGRTPMNRWIQTVINWEKAPNPQSKDLAYVAMVEAEKIARPFVTAMEYLKYGLALLLAGLTYWMLSHPDVVKEGIKALKDISIRVVDEISEAGDALSKIIDEMMPSILELIGLAG